MVIKADKEAADAIKQLCDIALRSGGIQNMEGVIAILRSIKLEEANDGADK